MLVFLMNADEIPSEQDLKNADRDPVAAVFRWLLMRGIRPDPTKEPQNLVQPVNEKEILDKWKQCMDPTALLHDLLICAKLDHISKDDYI